MIKYFQYFYTKDHLGTTSFITDKEGNMVEHLEYLPFGETFLEERRNENDWMTPYRFTGKEQDCETGLYYYGARYYDPKVGRFLSVDPLTKSYPYYTPYQFAGNSPIANIDLDGAEPLIATNYNSLESLKKVVDIDYIRSQTFISNNGIAHSTPPKVCVSYCDSYIGQTMSHTMAPGPGDEAMKNANSGGIWDKASVVLQDPRIAFNKEALKDIHSMAYTKNNSQGTSMLAVARALNSSTRSSSDLTNTFLHVFGQAIITTLYGEGAANVAADIHERDQLSLITGQFENGEMKQAIDNYADIVNNKIGQYLGNQIADELGINSSTEWTPELTSQYLGKIQEYFEGSLGLKSGSKLSEKNETVKKFTNLINEVRSN